MSERVRLCTLLTDGYIRIFQNEKRVKIPTSILGLCFDFFFIADPTKYDWTVCNKLTIVSMKSAANKAMWRSPTISIYGFQFHIKVYPCGVSNKSDQCVSFRLRLESLPSNIDSVQLSTRFTFVQADVDFVTATVTLSRNKLYTAWHSSRLRTEDIQQFNIFTFRVEPQLIAVFDVHGNDIRQLYENTDIFNNFNNTEGNRNNYHNNLNVITPSPQTIETNDITNINSKLDYLITKVDFIAQRLISLEKNGYNNHHHVDFGGSGKQKVKQWLQNEVELPEYYDLLINNGIDNLSIVSLLTMDTIKGIGIEKIGHQLKILNEVNKLKENN